MSREAKVTFGPFQLDLHSSELRRSGIAVKLQPQPARLLVMLVARAGQLVSREEIRSELWSADTFVDFDQSVNFCIRQIRTALRDDADQPCYVETVPKRGYRFIAPVQQSADAFDPALNGVGAPAPASRRSAPALRFAAAILVFALLASAALVWIARRRFNESAPSNSPSTVIASTRRPVDSSLREQVMLGRFFLNRAGRADVTKAIELFQAAISKDAECAPAYAGLADAYSRLGSVFVAGSPSVNARLLALRAATRATQLDPELAEAYASVGYVTLHELDWDQAAVALQRALHLNPSYAPAHTIYASYLVARGRPAEAVQEAHRALDLEPVALNTRHTFAWMLYFNHDFAAAIRELQTTLQMDPSYAYGRWRLGQVEIVTRRFDDAVRDLERAAADGERTPAIVGLLAIACAGQGRRADAQRILDELKARSGSETIPPGAITLAYIAVGDHTNAIASLEQVIASRDGYAIYMNADPLMDPLRSDDRFKVLSERLERGSTLGMGTAEPKSDDD